MMTHYLDILIRAAGMSRELHSRLLTAAHRLIVGQRLGLAVDWPDWRSHQSDFGLIFRVFGTTGELALYRDAIEKLDAARLVSIQPIRAVPDTDTWVMVSRDNSGNKLNGARIRRHQRRALARGDTPPEIPEKTSRFKHYLVLQSTSQGTRFPLGVRRRACSPDRQPQAKGRSYGLGVPVPSFLP